MCGELMFRSNVFTVPLLSTYFALAFGLYKVGKTNLLRYIPLFLAFVSALQMVIFLETKIRFKEERHRVKLTKGQYYHVGSEIRMLRFGALSLGGPAGIQAASGEFFGFGNFLYRGFLSDNSPHATTQQ
jgi:hypothetical protein